MAIGHSGGAYGTTERSPNYLGQAINNVEDNAFRYRAEKRLNEEKVKAEKEAEKEKVKMPDLKNVATLNGNLEKTKAKYAIDTQNAFIEAQKIVETSKDPIEKANAVAKIQNLKNNYDMLNSYGTQLNDRTKYIAENKGTKYDEQSAEQVLYSAIMAGKGYSDIRIEPDGQIKFDVLDENGKIIEANQTFASHLAKMNEVLPKSTYNEDLLKYQSKYKVDKTTTGDATGRVITDQRVDRKEGSKDYNNALEYAQAILSKDNERKIIARSHNIDPNDTKALEKFVTNDLLNSLPSEYSNVADSDLQFQKTKEATRKAEKKKQELEVEDGIVTPTNKIIFKEDVAGSKNSDGTHNKAHNPNVKTDNLHPNSLTFQKPLKLTSLGGADAELNNVEIIAISLDKDGKNIIGTGFVNNEKSSRVSETTTEDGYSTNTAENYKGKAQQITRVMSATTKALLARKLGLNKESELIAKLKKLNNVKDKTLTVEELRAKYAPKK